MTLCELLDTGGRSRSPGGDSRAQALLDVVDLDRGERLVCGFCGEPITSRASKIEVDGAHEHRRTNPAGLVFRIGCFRSAPGCVSEGEATERWSWFPGHAWQVALCKGCRAHLGWSFWMEGTSFFGLILRRLVAVDDRGALD